MYTHYANFQFNFTHDFFFAIIFLPQKILRNPTCFFSSHTIFSSFQNEPCTVLLLQGHRTFRHFLQIFKIYIGVISTNFKIWNKGKYTCIYILTEWGWERFHRRHPVNYIPQNTLCQYQFSFTQKVTVFLGRLWTVHFWEEFEMTEL